MAKKSSFEDNNYQFPGGTSESVGKDVDTFKQSDESKNETVKKEEKKTDSDMVALTFKHNRTFELRIGRKFYRFEGKQSLNVPRSVLEHKDFENARKYFLIKEVKK